MALYPYRAPTIGEILEGIGVACDPESHFTAVTDNLPAVKWYLCDPAIFRSHVLAQAERLHAS